MPKKYFKRSRKPKSKSVPKATKKYVKKVLTKAKPIRQYLYEYSAVEVTNTANIADIAPVTIAPAGGADEPEAYRDEDSIKPIRLDISGVISRKATATIDNFVRMVVFTWKQNRDLEPSGLDLFGNNFTYGYVAPTRVDIDASKNIKILYDKLFHFGKALTIAGTSAPTFDTIPIKKIINLKRHPTINFNSGSGTSGTNHIYVCLVGNSGTGTQTCTLTLDLLTTYVQ